MIPGNGWKLHYLVRDVHAPEYIQVSEVKFPTDDPSWEEAVEKADYVVSLLSLNLQRGCYIVVTGLTNLSARTEEQDDD